MLLISIKLFSVIRHHSQQEPLFCIFVQPGCEYGDKAVRFCRTLIPWECYRYQSLCCGTCAAFKKKGNPGTIPIDWIFVYSLLHNNSKGNITIIIRWRGLLSYKAERKCMLTLQADTCCSLAWQISIILNTYCKILRLRRCANVKPTSIQRLLGYMHIYLLSC